MVGPGGHYNSAVYSVRFKTSFKLNPVTKGKQGTFPFLVMLTNLKKHFVRGCYGYC